VSACAQKISGFGTCLTMAKLKMNGSVPNKIADLLKKINLMGTEQSIKHSIAMAFKM